MARRGLSAERILRRFAVAGVVAAAFVVTTGPTAVHGASVSSDNASVTPPSVEAAAREHEGSRWWRSRKRRSGDGLFFVEKAGVQHPAKESGIDISRAVENEQDVPSMALTVENAEHAQQQTPAQAADQNGDGAAAAFERKSASEAGVPDSLSTTPSAAADPVVGFAEGDAEKEFGAPSQVSERQVEENFFSNEDGSNSKDEQQSADYRQGTAAEQQSAVDVTTVGTSLNAVESQAVENKQIKGMSSNDQPSSSSGGSSEQMGEQGDSMTQDMTDDVTTASSSPSEAQQPDQDMLQAADSTSPEAQATQSGGGEGSLMEAQEDATSTTMIDAEGSSEESPLNPSPQSMQETSDRSQNGNVEPLTMTPVSGDDKDSSGDRSTLPATGETASDALTEPTGSEESSRGSGGTEPAVQGATPLTPLTVPEGMSAVQVGGGRHKLIRMLRPQGNAARNEM